jgi:hypothetical protein
MKERHVQFNLISVCTCICLLSAIVFADNTIPSVDNVFRMSLVGGMAAEDVALEERSGSTGDETGTDPRDFSSKFMPYYRYTELDNGVKINDLTAFGMHAFTPKFAMTYEIPVYRNIDYGSIQLPNGTLPPYSDISSSGSTSGYGDLNLRFFYNLDWGGDYAEEGKSWSLFPVIETMLPTASDDILGGDTTIISPGITYVTDLPGGPPFGLGFIALMNFYDFDVDKGDTGQDYERFRGRWFWMQPLSKPGPSLGDGLYMLTEFQPVYDFEMDEFDLWMGPEFGKIIKEGQIIYIKPGWAFDPDPVDRKFTLEVGYRYFF